MKFEIDQTYLTNENVNIICYEKTDKFSFLCPFEIIEEDGTTTLRKHIGQTTVYSNEEAKDENPSPIETMESYFKGEKDV